MSYTSTYTLNSHCILWEALILNIIVERAPQFCSTYELNCGSFYCCAHNSNKNCSKKERVSLSFLPHVSFSWECQTVNYGKMNTTMLEVRVSFIFYMYGLIFKALLITITSRKVFSKGITILLFTTCIVLISEDKFYHRLVYELIQYKIL